MENYYFCLNCHLKNFLYNDWKLQTSDFRRYLPLFLFLCSESFLKHYWNSLFHPSSSSHLRPIGKSRKNRKESFARLISQMLSHFSVARIKDKAAHSSPNHLLFSTAVTLPPAQPSSCQDLHAGNPGRSSAHAHGLPWGRRGAGGAGGAAGGAGAGAEAELQVVRALSRGRTRQRQRSGRCGSASRGFPGLSLPRSHRWNLSFFKARQSAFRPVPIMPEDTWQTRSLSALPRCLARQSWGVFGVIRLSSSCRIS